MTCSWHHVRRWKQFTCLPIFIFIFFSFLVNKGSKTFLVFPQRANLLVTETQLQKCSLLSNTAGMLYGPILLYSKQGDIAWELIPDYWNWFFHDTFHNKNVEIKPNIFLHQTGCSNFCLKDKSGRLQAQMWYLWKSRPQYKSCHSKTGNFIASLMLFDVFSEHILLVCSWGFRGGFSLLTYFLSSHSKTREEEQKVKGSI